MTTVTEAPSRRRLKVLMLGLGIDGNDVGGTYASFRWIEALGRQADVTLLCLQRPNRTPTVEQLPNVRVVSWPDPAFLERFDRLRAQLKPTWPLFGAHARRWIAEALARGEHFDVAHQIHPQPMRFRSPMRFFDIPYVIGPVDGSLPTPAPMAEEVKDSLFVKLRSLDSLRLRYDPALRASYEKAALILGVAPYVADVLGHLKLQRFETRLERAGEVVEKTAWRRPEGGELRLLHVGRTVRTKGLRDMVRAMAHLRDLTGVTLTSAGDGPDLQACRDEATALGVADRIRFLGRIPRDEVEALYASSHIFTFPTFREPMGGVFFEAMRWALPVVTADYGGPQAIVDDASGVRVPVSAPPQFAQDIATAIRDLAQDPARLERLSQGSARRIAGLGTWDDKARDTIELYHSIARP